MSRNYKFAALVVLASIVGVLLLSGWGRTLLVGLIGMVLLPAWALLLASVFLIVCVIIGAIILSVSAAAEKHPKPADNLVDDEPVVAVDEEKRPRAA